MKAHGVVDLTCDLFRMYEKDQYRVFFFFLLFKSVIASCESHKRRETVNADLCESCHSSELEITKAQVHNAKYTLII